MTSTETTAADTAGLQALDRALDTAWMSRRLAEAGVRDSVVLAAEVLSSAPAKRAVVRYQLEPTTGASPVLIGKLYADSARAERVHELQTAVRIALAKFQGLSVPRPVALLREVGMTLHEAAAGSTLDTLSEPERPAAVEAAARWLAALHGSPIRPERRVNPDSEARKATERAARLAAQNRELAGPADRLVRSLDAMPAATADDETALHRDFHYQHVVFGHDVVTAFDLDEVRRGEVAIDVAHFCAYLRLLAVRERGSPDALAHLERAFVDAYAAETGYAEGARHRVHFGAACLKLADQLVRSRGPAPLPLGAERIRQAYVVLDEGLRCLAA